MIDAKEYFKGRRTLMGEKSSIEWTDSSWNPIRARRKDNGKQGWACVKVSPGCANCYAENLNGRNLPECGTGLDYTVPALSLVDFFIGEKTLAQPLHWKRPRKIFVGSMTDLFGEFVPDAFIDRIFAIMALCPQHTFIVLTKRSRRMREYLQSFPKENPVSNRLNVLGPQTETGHEINHGSFSIPEYRDIWPLPNVWLGVSVEDQQRADERRADLLATPAAVRWASYEPALGPVDFSRWMWPVHWHWNAKYETPQEALAAGAYAEQKPQALVSAASVFIDWIVVGGESGPGARPFNIAWARDTIRQCRAAGVRCFVKQMGAVPILPVGDEGQDWPDGTFFGNRTGDPNLNGRQVILRNRKGGDMAKWAEDLRVREFPEVHQCSPA